MKKVIVIGAGILGASTAYHLAKAGAEVIIIDRNDPGRATDAAAGIIGPWLAKRRNKAWYNLARAGAKYYPKIIAELINQGEENPGYQRVGLLGLHTDEKRLSDAEERVKRRKIDAPEIGEIEILTEAETNNKVPILAEHYQSIYIGGAARVDGNAVRNALLHAAENLGAKLIQEDAALLVKGNKIIGAKTSHGDISADMVVLAAGAWLNELLEPLDINIGVYPQKAQIIHLDAKPLDIENWPVIMPPNNQYILPFKDRIIIGATHETAAGFDLRVTAGGVHEVLAKAIEVAPALANLELIDVKVGYRPFLPESLPAISVVPNYQGCIFANGLGASGLTIGPYVGKELAKISLGLTTELHLADYACKLIE